MARLDTRAFFDAEWDLQMSIERYREPSSEYPVDSLQCGQEILDEKGNYLGWLNERSDQGNCTVCIPSGYMTWGFASESDEASLFGCQQDVRTLSQKKTERGRKFKKL